MSIDVHEARAANPFAWQLVGLQIEPVIALPEDRALARALVHDDERQLARAIRHLDQARLDSLARELLALQPARGIIADLAHITAAQSPTLAGDGCSRRLSSRKQSGGEYLGFRVEGRKAWHTDERVGRIEPDREDVALVGARAIRSSTAVSIRSTHRVFRCGHEPKTLCDCR